MRCTQTGGSLAKRPSKRFVQVCCRNSCGRQRRGSIAVERRAESGLNGLIMLPTNFLADSVAQRLRRQARASRELRRRHPVGAGWRTDWGSPRPQHSRRGLCPARARPHKALLNSASRLIRSRNSKPSCMPAVAASTRVSATVRGVRGTGASSSGAVPRPRRPFRPRRPAVWPRCRAATTRSDMAGGTSWRQLGGTMRAACWRATGRQTGLGLGSAAASGMGMRPSDSRAQQQEISRRKVASTHTSPL